MIIDIWKINPNRVLGFLSMVVLMSCGGYHASQHPDSTFQMGRGLNSVDEFGHYIQGQGMDPRFRKARVTTLYAPLRLKTHANSGAPSPSSGPKELEKNSEVDVFWPMDLSNNHIKVFVQGRALWVTYRASSGRAYVTLLEDIYLPSNQVAGSGTFVNGRPAGSNGSSGTGPFVPSQLKKVSMSSSAISKAHDAIEAVNLRASEVPTCQFNPIVGNNASKSNCYLKIVISKDFRDFIARYGNSCAVSAGRKTFGESPTQVHFHSSGAGQVRSNRQVGNSKTLSTHATGQAFDLYGITVYFKKARRHIALSQSGTDGASQSERRNHKFYWEFVECWRKSVQKYAACPCSGEKTGALTYLDNSAHRTHLHMSLPMCNRSRYNVSCI